MSTVNDLVTNYQALTASVQALQARDTSENLIPQDVLDKANAALVDAKSHLDSMDVSATPVSPTPAPSTPAPTATSTPPSTSGAPGGTSTPSTGA